MKNSNKNKKLSDPVVLLTGGTGFIGSHTAVELIESGYKVVVADNLSNSKVDMIEKIGRITGIEPDFYHIDVSDRTLLDRLFEEANIEAVIHLAGYKSVDESVLEPTKYYRNNIDTTLTLLEIMKNHGVGKLIFSSSAAVYGETEGSQIPETAPVGKCANPYGRTKYFIEQILTDAAAADPELSVVLLRYFNPIGAHESGLIGELPVGVPNNLIPYITQTAAGIREKLNIFGNDFPTDDGTGVRDYIHVVDLAKGHVSALRYVMSNRGVEPINLGTGAGYSVLEIVAAFHKATGISIPYEFVSRRPGDVARSCASVDKAKKLLQWEAEKNLEDMCRDAWRWQQCCIP